MTSLCLILDLISFFKRVAGFGDGSSAFADLSLILIAVLFLFINGYYLMWIISLLFKFPSYCTLALIKGILGMMESIH